MDGHYYYGETLEKRLPGDEYENFISSASEEYFKPEIEDENGVIAIDYTSGTTGVPKGCMYSHRSTYLHSLANIIEGTYILDKPNL